MCEASKKIGGDFKMKFNNYLRDIFAAIFFGITSAMGIQLLLQPAKIYTAGVMGAGQLISNLFAEFAKINSPVYLWYFIINVPIILIAWFKLGKRFTILSLIAVASSTIFIKFIPLNPITNDPMLASVFGGVMVGVGTGYCFRCGFSTGGTDIIALLVQKSTGKSVGEIGFYVNAIILSIAGVVFGWQLALYSIVSIYVTYLLVDKMYIQQQKITVTVYSHHIDDIAQELLKTVHRGVTLDHHLEGGYSGEQIGSATMVLTRYQLFFVRDAVAKIDSDAFINIQPTMSIMGNFFDN